MKTKSAMLLTVAAMLVAGAAAARHASALRRGHQVTDKSHLAASYTTMPPVPKFPHEYGRYLDPGRTCTGYLRVGCLYDVQNEQRRWYHDYIPKEDRVPMTPDVCYEFCSTWPNMTGAMYFGLLRGYKCYCTPFFHLSGEAQTRFCDMPCVGDHTRICGGENRSEIYEMHDCGQKPPPICHPKPPQPPPGTKTCNSTSYGRTVCCQDPDRLVKAGERCTGVECKKGYVKKYLHGTNPDPLRCEEMTTDDGEASWGQWKGSDPCVPPPCSEPPTQYNARYPKTRVKHPENVVYDCNHGYSVDGTADGSRQFVLHCDGTANRQLVPVPINNTIDWYDADGHTCQKIKCGPCPTLTNATLTGPNGEVEYLDSCRYTCNAGFSLDQQAGGLQDFSTMCLASGMFTKAPACGPVWCGTADIPKHSTLQVTDTQKVLVYEEEVKYQCQPGYKLDTDFSIGEAVLSNFTRKCDQFGRLVKTDDSQATENQGTANRCWPVKCGPLDVVNAIYSPGSVVFYPDMVNYTCKCGYWLGGNPADGNKGVATCGAEGNFLDSQGQLLDPTPECLPATCGQPPEVENAGLRGAEPPSVTFASAPLIYECKDGYSTDSSDNPQDPQSKVFSLTCKPDGTFSKAPSCVEINYCSIPCCGEHGTCKNDVSSDDKYTCQCDQGFELTSFTNATRPGGLSMCSYTCTNINDCPDPSSDPPPCGGKTASGLVAGICEDLVENYTCHCSPGYRAARLENSENTTCIPVPCGAAPEVENASPEIDDASLNFSSAPLKYTCNTGYTLTRYMSTSFADFDKTFMAHCGADGKYYSKKVNLSTSVICIPVSCGSPRVIAHATFTPAVEEVSFTGKVTYNCDEHYTLNGEKGGAISFEASCEANGMLTASTSGSSESWPECLPVECPLGTLELSHSALDTEKEKYVFGEHARIACDVGYSLDGNVNTESWTYELPCRGSLGWAATKVCQPVKCGKGPQVEGAISEDAEVKTFNEVISYDVVSGYTLDAEGKPGGARTFSVACRANGSFTPSPPLTPIVCPEAEKSLGNAVSAGTVHTFGEIAHYSCIGGYTLSGQKQNCSNLADTSFGRNCSADAEYTDHVGCQPIDCSILDDRENADRLYDKLGDNQRKSQLKYGDHATFKCHAGYSLDGLAESTVRLFKAACQVDATYFDTGSCMNNNDCEGPSNLCEATGGTCKDKANPTGTHVKDFACECPAGLSERNVTQAGRTFKYCGSEGVECAPGSKWCDEPGKPGCCPVKCTVAKYDNARLEDTEDSILFNETAHYKCEPGYTLDGMATEDQKFELICYGTGVMQKPHGWSESNPTSPCMPVKCGLAPDPGHADFDKTKEYQYKDAVTYTCKAGYSTDGRGSTTDNKQFQAECSEHGIFTDLSSCQRIKCGQIGEQANVTHNPEGVTLLTGERIQLYCLHGHVLKDDTDQTSYTIVCDDSGVLHYELTGGSNTDNPQCVPRDCHFTAVAHAQVQGSKIFGEQLDVTCDHGYSVQPQLNYAKWIISARDFSTACRRSSNSGWSFDNPSARCTEVFCGNGPFVRHMTPSQDRNEKTFGETVDYTVKAGFEGAGDTITLTCQNDGTYTQIPEALAPQRKTCSVITPSDPHPKLLGAGKTTLLYQQKVTYVCSPGWDILPGMTQVVGTCAERGMQYALADNTLDELPRCWKSAEVKEVTCTNPPRVVNFASLVGDASSTWDEGQEATYQCDEGHQIIAGTPPGTREFKVTCNAGLFEGFQYCEPVNCTLNNSEPFGAHTWYDKNLAANMVYGEKLEVRCLPGFALSPGNPTDNTYIASCGADGYHHPPKRCQQVTCSQFPNVDHANGTVTEGEQLTVKAEKGYSIDGSGNPAMTQFTVQCLNIGLFGVTREFEKVKCASPPDCSWNTKWCKSAPELRFVYPTIDFGETVTYTMRDGYVGHGTTQTSFTVRCKDDGTLGGVLYPTKIDCGSPDDRPNAWIPSTTYRFGDGAASYTCKHGFQTQQNSGRFEAECKEHGNFDIGNDMCTPVKCDLNSGPLPNHATQTDETRTELDYGSSVDFTCDKGYSTNGLRGSRTLTVTCQADGEQSFWEDCLDDRDCDTKYNGCSPHGSCVEKPNPEGDHLKDLECKCDDGYVEKEQTILEGDSEYQRKVCAQDDQCPANQCSPGYCNSTGTQFICVCPPGYTESKDNQQNSFCRSETCGQPEAVKHASTSHGGDVLFSDGSINYTCDNGYSLDATPHGERTFSRACYANKTLQDARKCKPVLCGCTPFVAHANNQTDQELAFGEQVNYTCQEGYTVNAAPEGDRQFSVHCLADGYFAGIKECQPIACETYTAVGASANAEFCKALVQPLEFDETAEVCCMPGFALHEFQANVTKYTIKCTAKGKYSLTPGASQCVPINCGDKPSIPNTDVSGSTRYGGELTVNINTPGFSFDGTPADTSRRIKCLATGNFTVVPKPQRVKCGPAPWLVNSTSVVMLSEDGGASVGDGGMSVGGVGGTALVGISGARRSLAVRRVPSTRLLARRSVINAVFPRFGDILEYTCLEGHRVHTNWQQDSNVLKLKCGADGQFIEVEPAQVEVPYRCVPVKCLFEQINGAPKPINTPPNNLLRYKQLLQFRCEDGYSLDGKPAGPREFTEVCQADGRITKKYTCKWIDPCKPNPCGVEAAICLPDNSTFSYTCTCPPGYEIKRPDGGNEKCVKKPGCTGVARANCGEPKGWGRCNASGVSYTCKCSDGYINQLAFDGSDSCALTFCGDLQTVPHATSAQMGIKMFYKRNATYECDFGYTIDGTATGDTQFQVKCLKGGTLSPTSSCLPVTCGAVVTVPNSRSNVTTLAKGETAEFTCDHGYTISGLPQADTKFTITCAHGGIMTPPKKCLPVECGLQRILNAAVHPVLHFGESLKVDCLPGFTIDGVVGTQSDFTVSCDANGKYTGIKGCVAVGCGAPETPTDVHVPAGGLQYLQQFQAVCKPGYSLDGAFLSQSSFVGKCGADGTFTGVQDCVEVTCSIPVEFGNASASGPALKVGEVAEWTCKDGYSVDGTPSGATSFRRQCRADGQLARASPSVCMDIDNCVGNPCSPNGYCTDSGIGKTSPGYKCECMPGYTLDDDGHCTSHTENGCASDPCGPGGVCVDVYTDTKNTTHAVDKDKGYYYCVCSPNFELHPRESLQEGLKECQQKVCTELSVDYGGIMTASGDAVEAENGKFKLKAGEGCATYTCANGYSTDGSSGPQSRMFTVCCSAYGYLSKFPDGGCRPVQCREADLKIPRTQYTGNSFEFGDELSISCVAGHTSNGMLDGPKEFTVRCQSDGTFNIPVAAHKCQPVTCGTDAKDDDPNAIAWYPNPLKYRAPMKYNCKPGYAVGGRIGAYQYFRICGADGTVPAVNKKCEPVRCKRELGKHQNAHHITNHTATENFRRFTQEQHVADHEEIDFGHEPCAFECEPGHTVGGLPGGPEVYEVECFHSGGEMSPVTQYCMPANVDVTGWVFNAADMTLLAGVKLTFTGSNTVVATTDSSGKYQVSLVAGATYKITTDKPGFDQASKDVVAEFNTCAIGSFDMMLSEAMPNNAWTVELTWSDAPPDLDSHTFFGNGGHVSFYDQRESRSGVTVQLDKDDRDGKGPEKTFISGMGSCTAGADCIIDYKVVDFPVPHDAQPSPLGAAHVKVLDAQHAVKGNFVIPPDSKMFQVTMNAASDEVQRGAWMLPPSLAGALLEKQWPSLKTDTWKKLDNNALLTGMKRTGDDPYDISAAGYLQVQSVKTWECSVEDQQSTGWTKCNGGKYLAGIFISGGVEESGDVRGQITKSWCCKPNNVAGYGACEEMNLFKGNTDVMEQCPTSMAIIGLHLQTGARLPDKAECCEFPMMTNLVEVE